MNSTVSDDFSREHLALEAAKCLKNIFANTQNITELHTELLEINLSFTAYIEESKRRLQTLKLDLAQQAKSSHRVVEVFNEKLLVYRNNMSRHMEENYKNNKQNDSNRQKAGRKINSQIQSYKQESARKFISWYERMIDNERSNLRLYLAENITLEWFGRTIKNKKKVSAFFNYDMQCSRHDFKTVESIDKIQSRSEVPQSKDDLVLASPLHSPELNTKKSGKRKLEYCSSPQWADGCKPADDECSGNGKKRLKKRHKESMFYEETCPENKEGNVLVVSNQGDNVVSQQKHKYVTITPPNTECGQGDCLPSTSGTASEKSHDTLNGQLPKLAVECNGFVEFIRSKNNNNVDTGKWDRKCKVQISYSEDPLHLGEYIIWAIVYNDESKCRRNLLAAFEEAAIEDDL